MRTISSNAHDGMTVFICMYVDISSNFKFVGGFQLTTVTFKRTCHVDPQSSGILLQKHHSFSLKLAPNFHSSVLQAQVCVGALVRSTYTARKLNMHHEQNILEIAYSPFPSRVSLLHIQLPRSGVKCLYYDCSFPTMCSAL